MRLRSRSSASALTTIVMGVCLSHSSSAGAQCPSCPGDMNGDLSRTGADIQPFVACVLTGSIPSGICVCADTNGSGTIDGIDDVASFVTTLLSASAECPPGQPGILFSPTVLYVTTGSTNGGLTLHLAVAAPAGGLSVDLATEDNQVATVQPTIVIAEGLYSVSVPVAGVALGTTTVTATATGLGQVTASIEVVELPVLVLTNTIVGRHLQTVSNGTLGAPAPVGNLVVTITSGDPTKVLLSTNPLVPGSTSITRTVPAGNTQIPTYYVYGLAEAGLVQIEASAPGYASGGGSVTLRPSAFRWERFTLDTPSIATNVPITIFTSWLDPVTLNVPNCPTCANQFLRGGLSPVMVNLSNSDPAVGALIGSPIQFTAYMGSYTVLFDPITGGTTTLSIETPAGFHASSNMQHLPVTVTVPSTNINDVAIGQNLQRTGSASLGLAPGSPIVVTITSSDPEIAALSTSATVAGTPSISFLNQTNTIIPTFYVHGISMGTATLTIQAPGYANDTATVTVNPTGFFWDNGTLNTTTLSANTSIPIYASMLDPVTLQQQYCLPCNVTIRAGAPVTVALTNTNSAVGAFPTSLTFSPGQSNRIAQFNPATPGTTTLGIQTPPGFSTPAGYQPITANVVTPGIAVGDETIGQNLQVGIGGFIGPPVAIGNVTVTITSNDPTKLLVSTTSTAVGVTSITRTVSSGSDSIPIFYAQALTDTGSAQLTVSAPGYVTDTVTITFRPSGIRWTQSAVLTTTFAANTPLSLFPYYLDPATMQFPNCQFCAQQIRAGYGPVTVNLSNSNPAVGTMSTNPVVINPGQAGGSTQFDPVGAGATLLTIEPPAGFAVPNNFQQVSATVTQPGLTIWTGTTLGRNLQMSGDVGFPGTPPNPMTVTLTSSDANIVALTTNPNIAGSGSVSFPNVGGSPTPVFYVQGIALGTATLTAQAPGLTSGTTTINVNPSGFRWEATGLNTTAGANNTSLTLYTAYLNNGTLIASSCGTCTDQSIRGGIGPVTVNVNNSNPLVGVLVTNPLVFNVGPLSLVTQFDPMTAGTTNLTIETPAGFDTPANYQQINVNVNP